MASKVLKGLTVKIGADTSDLFESLQDIEKKGKSLSSELTQINKLLKLDPTNTKLLAQKQEVLSEAILNTEKRLGTLKEAEKQAQEQFERGEISEEQYRALQREVIATEKKLGGLKAEAKETSDKIEELGEDSEKTGKKIKKQGEETEETEKKTKDLDDASGDLAAGGLAALAAAATAAVAAIVALAEESREYRTEMAKLDTAFTDAGFSAEAATETYEELQSVLGETEQAVEASNMLAKLCDSEVELAEWTEILTGVYGTFGTSLPVEALAESANETARTGQIAGNLADALNWAAAEGETFGVTLKKNTKANEEWNKKVKEAASAEDYFNLALEECSNEQERQQLITKTLTKLYGSAAKQYKKTNAEVIRANQATEKWNKATAKIGKAVEPVVTDIKELGTVLLEDASEPLADIADYIRKDVLPAIKKVGSWVKQNLPAIKAGLTGVAAAMVAFKVATIATEVAQKGLKGAIMATTVAQKALALAQAATPWGLIATAVAGVTVALMAYSAATANAKAPVDALTEEERKLMKAADEAANSFREQKAATEEALGDVAAEVGHVQKLAEELRSLADASGKVKEKDQERVQFILNELNEALGTEYTMVDGVIQKYKDLKTNIDEVIQAKLANSLLETVNADYIAAIQNESDALENLNLKKKDYEAQLKVISDAEAAYAKAQQEYTAAMMGELGVLSAHEQMVYASRVEERKLDLEHEKSVLSEKGAAYDKAAQDYSAYYNTIANYEEAQAAALSGNYQKAVDILTKKGSLYGTYSEKVDTETAKVLDALYKEALDAGLEAERTKKNFENGVEGYTAEMVTEAEKNYQKALDEFANAYADAESIGEDMTEGMTAGAEKKRSGLLAKARSLVAGFLKAARDEADTHSPSKKSMAIFEDIGEGAEIGVENKTEDVARAGAEQAAALMDAYSAQEVKAQRALRSIAEQQAAQQTAGQMTLASANGPMLEKILAAIERGQIITLDGDALVGATANKMDSALGRRRALASRGAI